MYIYLKEENSIVQPTMEKPAFREDTLYRVQEQEYEKHIATLHRIKVKRNPNWTDRQEVVEGKDFELSEEPVVFETEEEYEFARWEQQREITQYPKNKIAIPIEGKQESENNGMPVNKALLFMHESLTKKADLNTNKPFIELLGELEEYFEDRADCDYQGDPLEPVPNKEMRLLTIVQELKSKYSTK